MYTGKRTLDVAIAMIGLIIAMPCLLLSSFFLAFLSKSSPLFIQKRPGYLGKPFSLYKLRTMYDKKKGAHQILNRMGKWLRTYSMDELPQFFNVLRGDMSIVGPRPLLLEYLPLYNKIQFERHTVKPGMTGWAQINGRNQLCWEKRFELDRWYVQNQSLKLDLLIIKKTIQRLLQPLDVKPEGLSEEEKFKGNSAHQ